MNDTDKIENKPVFIPIPANTLKTSAKMTFIRNINGNRAFVQRSVSPAKSGGPATLRNIRLPSDYLKLKRNEELTICFV
ncbi:MAG: hypothetical protein HC906_04915 [Bacteroidales bacterium]|nr:hypothetical protein [Bacteroidales bacterium]